MSDDSARWTGQKVRCFGRRDQRSSRLIGNETADVRCRVRKADSPLTVRELGHRLLDFLPQLGRLPFLQREYPLES